MVLTIKEKGFFDKILRALKEFQQFSADFKSDEITLFDCQVYSQNFNYIIQELNKKINDKSFDVRDGEQKELIFGYLKYFIEVWNLIEELRMQKSIVKIFVNEFMFSEN